MQEDDEDQEEDADEDVEGENEEGHRFSKGSQGRLWSVFSAPRKHRPHAGPREGAPRLPRDPPETEAPRTEIPRTTTSMAVQWITKCECSECGETHPETTTKAIARIRILHRVHRTTVS